MASKANPNGIFLEKDLTNNEARTRFLLSQDSKSNTKIDAIDHSACDSSGMCSEWSTNH
ncbi:MAG: hypothetical protein ACREAE_09965 [Nitrosopumilaceae archaeon]